MLIVVLFKIYINTHTVDSNSNNDSSNNHNMTTMKVNVLNHITKTHQKHSNNKQ